MGVAGPTERPTVLVVTHNYPRHAEDQAGQFIRNAGYYWAPNDYFDVTMSGDYYQAEPSWVLRGDDYNFEDAQKDVGGNENLMKLVNSLKVMYPKLPVIEKVKK